MNLHSNRPVNGTQTEWIQACIESASHFLPAQGPITAFVHHNTLHAFQAERFDEAVLNGKSIFGHEPFWSSERFRREIESGRIGDEDLAAVLKRELGNRCDERLGQWGTRFELRMAMLKHTIYTGTPEELEWLIHESGAHQRFRDDAPVVSRDQILSDTQHWIMRQRSSSAQQANSDGTRINVSSAIDALIGSMPEKNLDRWSHSEWESFSLQLLWQICCLGVKASELPNQTRAKRYRRLRDLLLERTDVDVDELVNSLLIKFAGSFLDQGFAHWSLPGRSHGFWNAFLRVFAGSPPLADAWRDGLGKIASELQRNHVQPLDSIAESLKVLGVDHDDYEDFIREEFLALRGFAGMIEQVEDRGDRVFHAIPKGSLAEFLAARLILTQLACRYVARNELGMSQGLDEITRRLSTEPQGDAEAELKQRAFVLFQLAQILNWKPRQLAALSSDEWRSLIHEVVSFGDLERRHALQLAFERQYRVNALDAFSNHHQRSEPIDHQTDRPQFQMVCCIDDREESFRRHLEEIEPRCQTFGMAGFFAVVMYFKGLAEAHFTPLCPVIIKPQHYVREEAVYSMMKEDTTRRKRREAVGRVSRGFHLGSRTATAGMIGTSLLGTLATIPMVARIVAPRLTSRLRERFGGFLKPPQATELHLERTEDPPGSNNGHVGYSLDEMVGIVRRTLEDIGLVRNFSKLVIVAGHGSSSLNNPHESAYNCGACAGARGGPNARAYTQMANDARVRVGLKQIGIDIPDDTFFIGAYHNTCNDEFELFDLDRVPVSHRELLEQTIAVIDQARARNAHERCRRFRSAELSLSFDAALRHVEGRAQDLSQARPEYNHATNAICIVGRREWSRGLFLDRRAFLASYDPRIDNEEGVILTRILQAAVPVCAGISLEYYFSTVDTEGYGCGNKLPHNITALLGVMTGAESDLRPGLSAQMVEIHEPMRLLFIVDTTPQRLKLIIERNAGIRELVDGKWVQMTTFDPTSGSIHEYVDGQFVAYCPSGRETATAATSFDWYRGWRDHLAFASIGEFRQSGHSN